MRRSKSESYLVGPSEAQRRDLRQQEEDRAEIELILRRMNERAKRIAAQLSTNLRLLYRMPRPTFLERVRLENDFLKRHKGQEPFCELLSLVEERKVASQNETSLNSTWDHWGGPGNESNWS
jgi:hypothetical protein